jgi:hypothetical protein
MFASLVSAEIGFDGVKKADLNEELSNIEISAPSAAEAADKGILADLFGIRRAKEWTIMVFGNGKNDLEPFLLKDLNEMEKIGSSGGVNVVVEAGRIDGYDESDGDWKGVRRYLIKKDNDTEKVNSPVLKDMGSVDMGDYKSVIDFAKWAKSAYPAKKYMLIFWNHGAGWTKNGQPRITKGISYDEESGNHINTPQMATILKEIGGVDVVGTDACLMAMAEVNYEIKDSVKYIVASEETEPGDGYTYDLFLGPVVAKPTMTAMEVGKAAVDGYSNHYDGIDQGYTQSLVLASAMTKLPQLTDAFGAAVMAAGEKALAKSARDGAINYAYPENRDLYDFTRLVVEGTKNADVKAKGQALMNFITGELVLHSRARDSKPSYWSPAKKYSLSKGIAAYLPPAGLGEGYTDLAWAKATQWDEFALWLNQP